MGLNKNSSFVLLLLLNGNTSAAEISKLMNNLDIRTVQRALSRLTDLGLAIKSGARNNPSYKVQFENLLVATIPDKILEDEGRPETSFNHALIGWLKNVDTSKLERYLGYTLGGDKLLSAPNRMSAKELEYLTIELSWKSSALEGNTYTLLDTQLLLIEGIKAKNRTEFETQMILNHKDTIGFIVENSELFHKDIKFSTVEELHRIIGKNLGIANGVRKKPVKISASNYTPLANPHQLREFADSTLEIINQATNPTLKSLLALSLIPYLQLFEDGNKRTGRMLANAILISTVGLGFSLRKVSARKLALAYLDFYEFNSLLSLSKILDLELIR